MKRYALFTATALGLALLSVGCTQEKVVYVPAPQPGAPVGAPPPGPAPAPVAGDVVVQQAPPAAQVEVIPVSPGPAYVWAPGYWYWGGNRWLWYRGAYVIRPRAHAVWVSPHYVRRGGGYVWVGGYWR